MRVIIFYSDPCRVLGVTLSLKFMRRKAIMIISCVSGFLLLLFALIKKFKVIECSDCDTLILVAGAMSKMVIDMYWPIAMTITAETMPTIIRQQSLGVIGMCAQLASAIAPFVLENDYAFLYMPLICFVTSQSG